MDLERRMIRAEGAAERLPCKRCEGALRVEYLNDWRERLDPAELGEPIAPAPLSEPLAAPFCPECGREAPRIEIEYVANWRPRPDEPAP